MNLLGGIIIAIFFFNIIGRIIDMYCEETYVPKRKIRRKIVREDE